MPNKTYQLAYFVSHPIQYQAPLLKKLAAQTNIELTVFFLTDLSKHTYRDQGFDQAIQWDTPLLEGYRHVFLDSKLDRAEFSLCNPKVSLNSVKKALGAKPWDAIWLHGYNNVALLYLLWRTDRLNIPLFFRCDSSLLSSPPRFLKNQFIQWLVAHSSALLWSSSDNKDYYQYYGAKQKQLFFSPHAVDNDFFQSFKNNDVKTKSNHTKCILLFASKFIPRKNAPLLLEAYLKLTPAIQEQAELWFVGSGEQRVVLENRIQELGLEERVFLLGFKNQSELPKVLNQCDVFILPSEKEPFGLIINEAMNLGKAIICTDEVGAAKDLVEHNVNGWVIPANDITALSKALDGAIRQPETLLRMGQSSLNKINQWSFREDIQGIQEALSSIKRR